ncbi:hypothetical protein ACFQGA_13585 [Marinobacter koreensis]|uniref:hypothetical protein n=1 Tax=Marinobacter koreensis TaxID=335974 RepID=UPI00360EEB5C
MALIVFLLAYLIRRRLDNANHLSSDALWRLWFRWGSRASPGKEGAAGPALIFLLLPVIMAAVIEFELSSLGFWGLLYPLQLVVLVLMMGTPGWRSLLTDYSEAWSRGTCRQHGTMCVISSRPVSAVTPCLRRPCICRFHGH